ncbi:hypothetical protein IF125_07520 [Empedobacter stercoris]|uniref:hypothetical protein n=1 Tax=Empedobacter stercoris TaxID=1628248 RepID=UPI001CE1573E|nr:hypothetical protein [Empedobacter stercoris]MCA4782113.1 hypothetical protein [Empedobacter stercoris]
MKTENITLEDIYDFIDCKYGPDDIIPAHKQHILKHLELLDKIRAMHLRIEQYGSEDHIVQHLITAEGLSRYLAKKYYNQALEFFYCDNEISKSAWRNIIADKMERGINAAIMAAKDTKDFVAATKLWIEVAKIRELDKVDPPQLNPDAAGRMFAIYTYDPKLLGLETIVDKNLVKKFIDNLENVTEREKQLAYQEAMLEPLKLFPEKHEDVRKSD